MKNNSALSNGNTKNSPSGESDIIPENLPSRLFIIPLVTFIAMAFTLLVTFVSVNAETVGASDSKIVHVSVNGANQTVPTRASTVGDLLQRLEVELNDEDIVEPSLDAEIYEDNFRVNVYKARPVKIIDGNEEVTTVTAEPEPGIIAEKAGMDPIHPEDRVEKQAKIVEPADIMREGIVAEEVIIERAMPITVYLYGNNVELRTHAKTVGGLLVEKDIKLNDGDSITPDPATPINQETLIFIVRDGKEIIHQEEEIEPPIEKQADPSLDIGVTVVIEPGVSGKRVVTYEIDLDKGLEVGRKEIQNIVVRQPVKRVVKVGAKREMFGGSFEAALAALRNCEAGGNYSNKNNPTYRGAYQFLPSTWNSIAPIDYRGEDPADAPPSVQDQAATDLYRRSGWGQWPACSQKLGFPDIFR
jgi:uncharacterized protein YabE (DUF348 family)